MCGRFSFTAPKEKIQEQFNKIDTGNNLRINFNIAPTQHAYVITDNNPRQLQSFSWGLIPYWSKDGKKTGKLINARTEGIFSKPSFRMPIRKRRCWVLADSFYEWRKENGRKIPYRIFMKSEQIMVMAGIWDTWGRGDQEVKSFSILTTPSNEELSGIHNRMPLILTDPEKQNLWLEELSLEKVFGLLNTPENDILKMYRVSEKVNTVRNNDPELHEPVAEPPTLFDA